MALIVIAYINHCIDNSNVLEKKALEIAQKLIVINFALWDKYTHSNYYRAIHVWVIECVSGQKKSQLNIRQT